MLVRYLDIEGPLVVKPRVYCDERGHFFESWHENRFDCVLQDEINFSFVQENQSRSKRNVVRGLHYQLMPYAQGKLVRCLEGSIFDVAVDIRRESATYGQYVGINLSASNKLQFWIPPGFAHGFIATSKYAEVLYKTTDYWEKDYERSICWNDPNLDIKWPISWISKPILSEKDKNAPTLAEAEERNEVF